MCNPSGVFASSGAQDAFAVHSSNPVAFSPFNSSSLARESSPPVKEELESAAPGIIPPVVKFGMRSMSVVAVWAVGPMLF